MPPRSARSSVLVAAAAIGSLLVVPALAGAATAPAVDDIYTGNPRGESVVVAVLVNDLPDVEPATLAVVDPVAGPSPELVVEGEGTWSVVTPWSNERHIVHPMLRFDPDPGLLGDPTPIEYVVTSTAGVTGRASVTVTFQDLARSDQSLGNAVGETVVIDARANDAPSVTRVCMAARPVRLLEPTSVRDVCAIDDVVRGEGEWVPRVDDTVEFIPEPGFLGNPTPLQYSVVDADGVAQYATLVISYDALDPDDTLLGNPVGGPATIDVLGNDPIGFDAGTLVLIDSVTGEPRPSLDVSGEGRWSIGLDRRVTFEPEPEFSGDPTPVKYQVGYPSGDVATATITLGFQRLARNDCSESNVRGREIAIDVLANDDESLRAETLSLSGRLRERRPPGATVQTWSRDRYFVPEDNASWSVDTIDRRIILSPSVSSPLVLTQDYAVLDVDGVEHFGTITVAFDGAPNVSEFACGLVSAAPPTSSPQTTVPVTTVPATVGPVLPETGGSAMQIAAVAATVLAIGLVLVARTTRP